MCGFSGFVGSAAEQELRVQICGVAAKHGVAVAFGLGQAYIVGWDGARDANNGSFYPPVGERRHEHRSEVP